MTQIDRPGATPIAKPMPAYAGVAAVLALCVIISGAIWLFRRGPGATQSQHFARVPVTHVQGTASQPALSPDGAKVAYVWERASGAPPQIWMISTGENSPHMLTKGGGQYSSPTWSPDGKSLAYLRLDSNGGEVVIALADGTGERTVTRVLASGSLPFRRVDWSPDGRTLAVDDTRSATEPFTIYTVSLVSGEKKQITHAGSGIIGDVDPRFSPDGKSIAFIRTFDRGHQEMLIADLAGGPVRQVTSDNKQVSGCDWEPGTNALVFASDRGGDFRLWKVPADAPGEWKGTPFTDIHSEFPIHLSVAKNAPALVYSLLHEDAGIWRVDLQTAAADPNR